MVNNIVNDFEKYITKDASDRFKSKTKSDIIDGLSSIQGKSSQLASWAYLLDIENNLPFTLVKKLKRYESVTVDDVKRVYNKIHKE